MLITNRLKEINKKISSNLSLVAVSKTRNNKEILESYKSGQLMFGENKVQELTKKHEELPKNIQWHMIGHLQTNKVKYIAKFISLIHTVDSIKLMKEINKRAFNENRIIDCLIQIHIANEENKFGFKIHEINNVLDLAKDLKNINIKGLMGMGTYTDDLDIINNEFKILNSEFLKRKTFEFDTLSMGMSNDYKIALDVGSNMIRIGSLLFGKRNY